MEQARSRYLSSSFSKRHNFSAFFAALDCYTHPLSNVPDLPLDKPFDVVSMQFCMHYAFESIQKTRMMLENVTRWLRPGGRFIGTIPNDKLLLSVPYEHFLLLTIRTHFRLFNDKKKQVTTRCSS